MYLISGLTIQFYPAWLDMRVMLQSAAFMNTIAVLFVGPSKVFEFPNTVMMIGVGQFL